MKQNRVPKVEYHKGEPSDKKPSPYRHDRIVDETVVNDPMGYWNPDNFGKIVQFSAPNGRVSMNNVNFPVMAISNKGEYNMQMPGQEYQYKGDFITEYPMAKNGGWLDSLPMAENGIGNIPYMGIRVPYSNRGFQGSEPNLPVSRPEPFDDNLLIRQQFKESTFRPNAVSRAGARGLAQIKSDVESDAIKAGVIKQGDDIFNPEVNKKVQKWYMNNLFDSSFINKKGKNQSDSVKMAKTLAAYNWGRGNLLGYLNKQKEKGIDIYDSYDWIESLPKETKDYVNKILLKKDPKFEVEFSKAYKNYSYAYGGDPSLPNIEGHYKTGGWLDKYQGDINGSQVMPSETTQSFIPANLKNKLDQLKKQDPKYKQKLAQEKKFYDDVAKAEEDARKQEVADRKARIADSIEAQKESIIGNPNWREVLARQTQATGDKLRISDEPNFFDDYINPGVWIGDMASDLGQAPYTAKEMDSNLPYALAIGAPLLTGALEGIGGKSTKDFITNIISPVPFTGSMINKGLKKSRALSSKAGSKFKSEIDWGKWNAETPNHPELINEYNAIEKAAKKDGTWMKNPDGSAFQGSPEQFVQQQSSYFKKAFGDSKLLNPDGSPMFLYHGSAKKFDTFDPSKFQLGDAGYSGAGIYTAPQKTTANSYATSSAKFHSGDIEPTVYQLYGQGNRPIKSSDLIKENQGRDLFNFYRDRNWKGELSPYESLREYDVAVSDQLPNVQNIRALHDAREIVFPKNTQVKSAVGNIGFFDMTNPNIYKGVAPLGLGYLGYQGLQDEEYRRGGQRRRRGTSKNIKSSINDLFRRNYDVYGPAGKNRYDPTAYKTGGWLDNID
jgi:hypothetical protein